jgi:PAS domain S-box-containing protein
MNSNRLVYQDFKDFLGLTKEFDLRHQFFNFLLFVLAVINGAAAMVNLAGAFGPFTAVFPAAISVTCAVAFCLSRFRRIFQPLVWPVAVLIIAGVSLFWIFSGGSSGSVQNYLYLLPVFFVPFITGGRRVLFFLFQMMVVSSLFAMEFLYPQLVGSNVSGPGRLFDTLFSCISGQVILFATVVFFMRHYRDLNSRLTRLHRTVESRYSDVADSIPALIGEIDAGNRFIYLNRAGFELTGRTPADLQKGITLEDVVGREDYEVLTGDLRRLRDGGEVPLRECRVMAPDTTVKTLLTRLALPSESPQSGGALLFMINVTEKKELERQYYSAQKMESIGLLAGGVAHDFNNILTAVIGYASVIAFNNRKDGGVVDEQLEEGIQTIIQSSKRASELVRKLLIFSRTEPFKQTVFTDHDIINEVAGLLKHTIDKRIAIRSEASPDGLIINGDRSLLVNAVLNLAVNARDAMPQGGVLTIGSSAARSVPDTAAPPGGERSGKSFVAITIADTGSGMAPEVRSHLFEPFFSTKAPGKGTGLGLASVYGTVKGHNGFVTVHSEEGKGTSITMYLPVAETAAVEIEKIRPAASPARGHVLIVDDEDPVRKYLDNALRASGCTTASFKSPGAALQHVHSSSDIFNCAVVDQNMPEMNGITFIQKIHEHSPEMRVLMISGLSASDSQLVLRDRRVRMLMKPFDMNTLVHHVTGLIGETVNRAPEKS